MVLNHAFSGGINHPENILGWLGKGHISPQLSQKSDCLSFYLFCLLALARYLYLNIGICCSKEEEREHERVKEKEIESENHWGLLNFTCANVMITQEEPSPGWILCVNHSCSKLCCCFPCSHREIIYSWLPTDGLGRTCHAALLLSCTVETQSPWLGLSHQPLADLSCCTPPHRGRKLTSLGQAMAVPLVLSRTCSGQLRLKENQGEVSHSLKGHKTYGNIRRWHSQGEGLDAWPL